MFCQLISNGKSPVARMLGKRFRDHTLAMSPHFHTNAGVRVSQPASKHLEPISLNNLGIAPLPKLRRLDIVPASAPVDNPTFVPRAPGITDGPWNSQDSSLVKSSQKDAEVAVKRTREEKVLLGKSIEELQQLAVECEQPAYRGKQIYDALLNGATSIDRINAVPKAFRERLIELGYRTGRSVVHSVSQSADGTCKLLLQLQDGRLVECVGIPQDEGAGGREGGEGRLTTCVSAQVGCPMRCTFCATGKGGFARNLAPHEIVDQVLTIQAHFKRRVSNVVFMGMGEPLLNLPSVLSSYHFLNKDLKIGGRSITISTVGVPRAITRLARAKLTGTLAVSIHAPNQALRQQLVPSAKAFPLEALLAECEEYFKITSRRISFEYTLLAGVNDAPQHAEELAALLRGQKMMSHVNLIPWNPVDESEFQRPSGNALFRFKAALESRGIPVSVRITRGLDAAAACGQLRNQHQKTPVKEPVALT